MNYETTEARQIIINTEVLYNQVMSGAETWVVIAFNKEFDNLDQDKIDTKLLAQEFESDDNYSFEYNQRG